jgi:holliday junction DNA helicase RuvA
VYEFLRGEVAARRPSDLVVDVRGVGYRLTIPLSSYERLPDSGEVTIYTHLHVREDALRLFGFATREERKHFQLLLTVSGIGPTVALGIVSGISLEDFRALVVTEDVPGLTRMKGVGKKLAQRIVLELQDILKTLPSTAPDGTKTPVYEDAILALMALGYTRAASEKALGRGMKFVDDRADISALVRAALAHAG